MLKLGRRAAAGGGSTEGTGDFRSKRHPTYFRFEKLKDGETLERTCEHGRRCRLRLVTDVENEYFVREIDRGRYHVAVVEGALKGRGLTSSINLYNGAANCSIAIPEEDVASGDVLALQITVEDDVIPEAIINIARVTIRDKAIHDGRGNGKRREHSGGKIPGSDSAGANRGNAGQGPDGPPMGIELPTINKVRRDGWDQRGFDEHSACTVIEESAGDADDERSVYEFYVNVDNLYLQTDVKDGTGDPAMVEEKFVYGNVLVGLALIHDKQRTNGRPNGVDFTNGDDDEPIARRIEQVTRALSPFLVPMVEYLGGLESEEVSQLAQVGDEE